MHDRRVIVMAVICGLLLTAGVLMAVTMRGEGPTSVSTSPSGEGATSTTTASDETSMTSSSTTAQEATTTTQPGSASGPVSATTRHEQSGLVLTVTATADRFRSADEVALTLVVRNESGSPRTYNSSPGPRFALLSGGKQVWSDGCETAHAAIFMTDDLAPGQEVSFSGRYPMTLEGADAETRKRCEQPPGEYALTGIFQWCPNGDTECEAIPIEPVTVQIVG